MISETEARDKILAAISALPAREIALAEALNCFAGQDYFARLPLPNFDNSAMDGYAVMAGSAGLGSRLRVIAEQPAGVDRHLSVSTGEAARIFTGAPMPAGADAVVMQEDVSVEDEEIIVHTTVEIGGFVRKRGCDLSEGQKILAKGQRIGATTLGLLASQGFAEVMVGGEVRAGIISTGDELAKPGEKLVAGQIYDSNSVFLQALLKRCDAIVASVEHCPDDSESLIKALGRETQNQILVITGGVSVGQHDLVKAALQSLGGEIEIWRVAIKPGKPFLFGRVRDCFVFGLPGNPVSAYVTFLQFVRPAILKMSGASPEALQLTRIPARLTVDLRNEDDRAHYVRGKLENNRFAPVGRQESHALYGLSQSNALLRLDAGAELKRDAAIEVEIWD